MAKTFQIYLLFHFNTDGDGTRNLPELFIGDKKTIVISDGDAMINLYYNNFNELEPARFTDMVVLSIETKGHANPTAYYVSLIKKSIVRFEQSPINIVNPYIISN